MVAAGHPLTAQAGADVLGAGGNAVDAAVAAMLTSWVAEPLLSGPGAGGYMLVAEPGEAPVLLDFFVAAPGYGRDPQDRAPLVPVEVDFGSDATQIFHVGAGLCGQRVACRDHPGGALPHGTRLVVAPRRATAAPERGQNRRGMNSGTSSSVTPRPPPRRAGAGSGGGGR